MSNTLKEKLNIIKTEKDTKIIPGNIKSGVEILGITGTLEGEKYNLSDSITLTNTILSGNDTAKQLDIKNTLLNEENMCTQTFINSIQEVKDGIILTNTSIPEAIIKTLKWEWGNQNPTVTEHDLESLSVVSFFDSNPDLKFYNRRWRYNSSDIQEISFDELNYILDAGLIINQARGGSYNSSYYYDCTYYFKVPKGQTLPYCDDTEYWLVEQIADLSQISGENIKAQISMPDIITYSDNNYDYWCFLYRGTSPIYLTVLNKLRNLKSNDMNFGVINTYVD